LTNTPYYDAEATVSPKGDKIVFTSLRTGDLELFTMNLDGSDVKQITFDLDMMEVLFLSGWFKKLFSD
jgi:Tol biopolymer transport system component